MSRTRHAAKDERRTARAERSALAWTGALKLMEREQRTERRAEQHAAEMAAAVRKVQR